jgi:ABC-type transport system involved in multi-copper enzyme maturation permease subunit
MTRILGPVFAVELARNARKGRFVWLRGLYAALMLVALVNVTAAELAGSGWRVPLGRIAALAAHFFWAFGLVQLLAVLLLTPVVTAGTLADEKERGTLACLLTTDLSNAEIVLGKLAARLLLIVGVLAAGLPGLALALFLGGVLLDNLVGILAVTLTMLLATAALSVWASTHARRGREAVQLVYLIGVVLGLFPPLFALSPIPWPNGLIGSVLRLADQALVRVNPVVWLMQAWQTGSLDWPGAAVVLAANGALAVVLTGLGVLQLRRAALRHASGSPPRWTTRLLRRCRPAPGRWAVLWKEVFTETPAAGLEAAGRAVVAFIGWGALVWMLWAFAISVSMPPGNPRTPFRVFAMLVEPPLLCVAFLGLVVRAATCVTAERERGTWDGLLAAPMGAGEIVCAKLLGCLLAVRRVWLLVGLLWALGVTSGQLGLIGMLAAVAVAVAIALCAATLGLGLSLRLATSLRALGAALAVSVFLSGGYLLCGLPFFAPAPGQPPPAGLLSPCVPVLVTVSMVLGVNDLPHTPEMAVICKAGGLGYTAAWLILLTVVWRRFDRWASRMRSP